MLQEKSQLWNSGIDRSKASTRLILPWNKLKIPFVYTIVNLTSSFLRHLPIFVYISTEEKRGT